jgi:hypothetical protein
MEQTRMTDAASVRSEIVDFLRSELVGPDPGLPAQQYNPTDAMRHRQEILRPQDPPRLRYSAGVLFPLKAEVEQAEAATEEEVQAAENAPAEGEEPKEITPQSNFRGEKEEGAEQEVNRANEFLPSAMGLSALVLLPKQFKVRVTAGRYEKKAMAGLGRPDKMGKYSSHYCRVALEYEKIIDCAVFNPKRPIIREFPLDTAEGGAKLSLNIFSRPYARATNAERERIITFTLINRNKSETGSPKDEQCFFQCRFEATDAADGDCFLEYPEKVGEAEDEEEASLRLLYRHRKTFAVGHGCAANWPEGEMTSAKAIWSETLPAYEIKPILPNEIPGLDLSMDLLGRRDDPDALERCRRLAVEYAAWIESEQSKANAPSFPAVHKPAALKHLEKCRECHKRILDGVAQLESNADTRQAFAWMNQAMLMQQVHYDLAANHKRDWSFQHGVLELPEPYQVPPLNSRGKGRWRPFQLAFILMNLRSMTERESDERKVVDLIWFPTGGGKTEAYLGLTAFVIFWRRLEDPENSGTTVLMRYTLRLLTTQQFQRAASLICACEMIRRVEAATLGEERISIGLWVGGDVTPNKQADAVKALHHLLSGGRDNPFVIINCPWCGVQMGPVPIGRGAQRTPGYEQIGNRVTFRCKDPGCEFSKPEGLPLHVIDEAIYEHMPTLLVGTVDKFALLPWYPQARSLFGLNSEGVISPPDLIIQDELHLISGALGSMVGHYEGVLEALCSTQQGKKWGPKIVASTATICRAEEQVKALYARPVFLFPPQGSRAGDSFFATEKADTAGRLYVGVFTSALSSHVTAQIRVMAALLQSVKCSSTKEAAALDPYWTLMAYFNSLRELGHAATLIRADIRDYLNAMWDRLNIRRPEPGTDGVDGRRFINRDLELTSRIQSSAITEVLQQLFNPYPGGENRRPVDVCLATNMIQVGLDVPRLGLMTVVGQPKTTSEYIQATSRVGRSATGPGLVLAVYNAAKPRDRSHYEHFRAYHQSIYRWVEPTSVTPFAVPVRERALHAQIVTLARYWGDDELQERPQPPPPDALVKKIRDILMDRVALVDAPETNSTEEMIDEIVADWRLVPPPKYGHFGPPPDETPLMYPSGSQKRVEWADRALATPSSMRNVDAGCDAAVISEFPQP